MHESYLVKLCGIAPVRPQYVQDGVVHRDLKARAITAIPATTCKKWKKNFQNGQNLRVIRWTFAKRGLYFAAQRRRMPFRVSEIQPTPNPNAAKFVLDRQVSPQPTSFFNAAAAQDHPLAKKLFAIDGVASLLFLGDFITVNKQPNVSWDDIAKSVRNVLEKA